MEPLHTNIPTPAATFSPDFAARYFEQIFERCHASYAENFKWRSSTKAPVILEERTVSLREGRPAQLTVSMIGDPLSSNHIFLFGELTIRPDEVVGYYAVTLHRSACLEAVGGFYARFPGMGIGGVLADSTAAALGKVAALSGRTVCYQIQDARSLREEKCHSDGDVDGERAEASIAANWSKLFGPGGRFEREAARYPGVSIIQPPLNEWVPI